MNNERCFWSCADRRVPLDAPLVMGILNVTPDSFYDGGRYFDMKAAADHAMEMAHEGADIIDIGGESTRPGADNVSIQHEIERVVPVIEKVVSCVKIPVSVDTRHVAVAAAALEAGACIVNNIMPLDGNVGMAALIAGSGAGLVVMHMRGTPQTMDVMADYDVVEDDVFNSLKGSVDFAVGQGVSREQLVIDPGIGFAKKTEHNLRLIARLERLREIAPVLIGASRKRFIGEICSAPDAGDRAGGSIGAALMSVLHGASVVRVHDIKETRQALDVARAVMINEV